MKQTVYIVKGYDPYLTESEAKATGTEYTAVDREVLYTAGGFYTLVSVPGFIFNHDIADGKELIRWATDWKGINRRVNYANTLESDVQAHNVKQLIDARDYLTAIIREWGEAYRQAVERKREKGGPLQMPGKIGPEIFTTPKEVITQVKKLRGAVLYINSKIGSKEVKNMTTKNAKKEVKTIVACPEKVKEAFTRADNEDALKAYYLQEAHVAHPERGGDAEVWREVTMAYKTRFRAVKGLHAYKSGEVYQEDVTEKPGDFPALVDGLMALEGLKAEQIGRFVWCSGKQAPHKTDLRAMGFKLSHSKKKWYKSYEGYEGQKNGATVAFPKIKRKYGFPLVEAEDVAEDIPF